jgi:hypothetical protein
VRRFTNESISLKKFLVSKKIYLKKVGLNGLKGLMISQLEDEIYKPFQTFAKYR